jgi:hypothetical protein
MYKLCYPNGTVFQTYETRIDAELDQELMFDETVIVYEEPSPDTYPRVLFRSGEFIFIYYEFQTYLS